MNTIDLFCRRVAGFISKNDAHDMLRGCNPGTFLLRFSETEIGGISVAYVPSFEGGKDAALFAQYGIAVMGKIVRQNAKKWGLVLLLASQLLLTKYFSQ